MKVYFNGDCRWHEKYQRPCRRLPIHEVFAWKGYTWHLLSAYVCRQGLVLDFAKEIPAEAIREFAEKWKDQIRQRETEELQVGDAMPEAEQWMEYENPLETRLQMKAWVNGKEIESISGRGCSYNPLFFKGASMTLEKNPFPEMAPAMDEEAAELMEHYELDKDSGWYFWRMSLRWEYKRIPGKLHLKLELEPDRYHVPCKATFFTENGQPEQRVSFTHPLEGTSHTLVIKEAVSEELPEKTFGHMTEYIFPRHLQSITYHMEDPVDEDRFLPRDTEQSDAPILRKEADKRGFAGAAGVTVISGHSQRAAHGKDRELKYQASRLSFRPVEHTRWRIEAIVTRGEYKTLEMEL